MTRLFFLPWRREARGSVDDLDWLTTALPPVGSGSATHTTTLCIYCLPVPQHYYYTPWPQVAPLKCQPPTGPCWGFFSPSIGVNNLPSGHRLARSSFSHIYGLNVYIFVYVNPSWAISSSLHSTWSLYCMCAPQHVCCFCATFSRWVATHPTSSSCLGAISWRVLAQTLRWGLFWMQQGQYQISPQIKKRQKKVIEYIRMYAHLLTIYMELTNKNTTITRQHIN